MTTSFGWKPERTQGIWRHGMPCLRPFVAAAPWITVALLLLLFHLIGGTLVSEKGTLFDLPEGNLADGVPTGSVALLVHNAHDTMVFFDDSRYLLGDNTSVASLADHLKDSGSRFGRKTLLALADKRIPAGNLIKFSALTRERGIYTVLFPAKKSENEE